jgi:hypothetical protein
VSGQTFANGSAVDVPALGIGAANLTDGARIWSTAGPKMILNFYSFI